MREPGYTSREAVKAAVDVSDSARANAQIDRLIADASRSADRLCHRTFYPWTGTVSFDWPDDQSPTSWRFWLYGTRDLYRVDSVTSGGAAIDPAAVLLYPSDGPAYDRIEISQAGAAAFDSGATDQNSLMLTGLWCPELDERPVAALLGGITALAGSLDVADSSAIGVGHVLRCGDERMIVTERMALDTGFDLAADLGDQNRNVAVSLTGPGAALVAGEVVLIDGERMRVNEVVGSTAYVSRGYDGTVLAAHSAGTAVYAYRTLFVERGALGTTAAAHADGDALLRWVPPAPIEGLVIAETLTGLAQESSGYARVIGDGENQREARGAGLADKRRQVRNGYAKMLRQGVV